MDPLSIISGTVGILAICVALTNYLKEVKDGSERADDDIEALYQQVAAIGVVVQSIQSAFKSDIGQASSGGQTSSNGHDDNIQALWKEVRNNLINCQETLDKLFILISKIVGKETSKHSKFEGFRRYLRKESTEDDYNRIRTQLSGYHHALQTLLTSVNIVLTKRVQSTSDRSFTQISADIAELRASLRLQISPLQASPDSTHFNTLTLATSVLSTALPNEHFYAQPVSSIFTGRKTELEKLKRALLASPDQNGVNIQRRFVVFGLGGSGKTQFCSKFAQENRQSFWGVFWIDASSDETAKQSFMSIAKTAGKDPPSDIAAKNWLSNTKNPWLLVIDNADKLEKPLDSYFPQGERGCILVTTRNFELAQHGTCGDRYYHFSSLEEDEANNLLLRAAEKPSPWAILINELAARITKALGFLPLAVVHAGRAILGGVRMEDYLTSYDRHFDRLRKAKRKANKPKDENYTIIYSTYETLFQRLEEKKSQASEDAIYILKLFSYFHRENIRFDMLLQAVTNPRKEQVAEEQHSTDKKASTRKVKPKTWNQTLRDAIIELYTFLAKLGAQPVLSDLLIWKDFSEPFDDSRLRDALQELQRMSLVTRNPEKDSYSMHPVVHQWIRKRAEMSMVEQGVFCHAAATVLTQAILLPPEAVTERDEDFRRDLAAHVDHVQRCHEKLRDRMVASQKSRAGWKLLPVMQPQLDRAKCLQLGKFSYVYIQSGRFKEASELQYEVFNFLEQTFGMEHESTLRIAAPLASVLRHLDRAKEAAELQERILRACTALWGNEDPQVLEATSALGTTRWQQGRLSTARDLHQRALDGYIKVKERDHPDTLNTMSKLADDHTKLLNFDEAIRLHSTAATGLKVQRGSTHEDTLAATKGLATTYLERVIHREGQPSDLDQAYHIMEALVAQRKSKSGKEHGLTLWAIADFARVKNARGAHEEAEADFRTGLPVVEQNFGPDHIGTLYGKTYLGHVLLCRQKYDEAEALLTDVVETHQRLRPNHPDQLVGLSFLLKCYDLTARPKDAAKVRDRIEAGLDAIGVRGHAWEKQLFDAWVPEGMEIVSSPTAAKEFDSEPPPYELVKRTTM